MNEQIPDNNISVEPNNPEAAETKGTPKAYEEAVEVHAEDAVGDAVEIPAVGNDGNPGAREAEEDKTPATQNTGFPGGKTTEIPGSKKLRTPKSRERLRLYRLTSASSRHTKAKSSATALKSFGGIS